MIVARTDASVMHTSVWLLPYHATLASLMLVTLCYKMALEGHARKEPMSKSSRCESSAQLNNGMHTLQYPQTTTCSTQSLSLITSHTNVNTRICMHVCALQVVYVEAISNPLMQVPDLPEVVAFAKQHNLTSVIDATFVTPVLLQPVVQLGFDLVIHSATKYLNGHSDVIAGVMCDVMMCHVGTNDCFGCSLQQLSMRQSHATINNPLQRMKQDIH